MKVLYHKKFDNRFEKLSLKLQEKVVNTIDTFRKNPFEPTLKNHPLKGHMYGRRAISVTGDLRIVFEEHDNYILVVMLDVGTHPQVYRA